jgi:hypothetical protein
MPFFTKTGMMHSALGGWQLTGITTFQTGTPFNITNNLAYTDNAGVGNGTGTASRPDVVGNPFAVPSNVNVSGQTGPLLFNPNAFAAPQGLTFGNIGRDFLNNPSRTNFDMGLFKHFAITEARAVEFRAEAYNIFNHTQWNGVNTQFGGANFLLPSGAHNPRILQLAMKFLF